MQSIHLSINTTEGPGPEWGVADDLLCVYNCVQVEEIRQLVDSELGYATGTTLHTKRSKVSNKFTYYVLNCYPLQISRHCHICCGDHSPPVPLYCPFSPLLFLSSPSSLLSSFPSLLSPLLFSSFLLSLLSSAPRLFLHPLPPPPVSHFLAIKAGTMLVTTSVCPCTSTYCTSSWRSSPFSLAQAILSKQASLHRTDSSWTTGSVVKMARVGGLGRKREGWRVREKQGGRREGSGGRRDEGKRGRRPLYH